MLPKKLLKIDKLQDSKVLSGSVKKLTIAEIEGMSLTDISRLQNRVLKDLLNDAIRNQFAYHLGGSYTTAPMKTVGEQQKEFIKHSAKNLKK